MLSQFTPKPPRDRRAYSAAYNALHREQRHAAAAVYRSAHREEIAATRARSDIAHRADIRARDARYRAAHREEIAAYQSTYRAAHPEKALARVHVRLARLRGVSFESVDVVVLFERDGGICGVCGKRVYKNARDKMMRPGHDHILPISKGGANTYANSRLVHRRCNVVRGNRGAAQLRMMG